MIESLNGIKVISNRTGAYPSNFSSKGSVIPLTPYILFDCESKNKLCSGVCFTTKNFPFIYFFQDWMIPKLSVEKLKGFSLTKMSIKSYLFEKIFSRKNLVFSI